MPAPSAPERDEDAAGAERRRAERLAPLRLAYPLPGEADARFAELLDRLKGVPIPH